MPKTLFSSMTLVHNKYFYKLCLCTALKIAQFKFAFVVLIYNFIPKKKRWNLRHLCVMVHTEILRETYVLSWS